MVQYKQDFYRHVYERVVGTGWSGPGWAGGQGLMRGTTAQPCLGVWVIYLGLCSLWFQLRLLFRGGAGAGGGTNCQHSSSADAIGQCARFGPCGAAADHTEQASCCGNRPFFFLSKRELNLPNLKKIPVERYTARVDALTLQSYQGLSLRAGQRVGHGRSLSLYIV